MIGSRADSFSPATITTKSVASARDRIAAERKVSLEGSLPSTGGQGSNALSRPMRELSPAAKMTPAKPAARDMLRKITERRRKVSAWKQVRMEMPHVSPLLRDMGKSQQKVCWSRHSDPIP